ncbi:MAG: sigma-70 family RNA polymerase sigma factor [Phycisphaerae bacterium]|nr:sigma-70 family RNA polymerase sigma factor [Phycisphaerae bacterium]
MSDGKEPQSEAELPAVLAAAAKGDERAWRTLVDLYSRRVFALAKSRVRRADVAEEVTQSVFATLACKLSDGSYTEQGRFEAWLFRVAMNRIRDEIRKARRSLEVSENGLHAQTVSTTSEGGSIAPELRGLRDALARLSAADREVVELRHHAGMSFNQIAELLAEPLGTLLARHHRALRKLKELLTTEPEIRSKGMDP